jgi:hypothetical protein
MNNNLTAHYLRIRESDSLSMSISRDSLESDDSELVAFCNHAATTSRSILEFVLLGSCVILNDLWDTLYKIPDYVIHSNAAIAGIGSQILNNERIRILNKMRGFNSSTHFDFPIDDNQFEMTSAINDFITECENFLGDKESNLSCAYAISMMAEAFSNCGVPQLSNVNTEWFYSDELLSDIVEISSGNLFGDELIKYAQERAPRIRPLGGSSHKRWRGFPSLFILNSEHPTPLSLK